MKTYAIRSAIFAIAVHALFFMALAGKFPWHL